MTDGATQWLLLLQAVAATKFGVERASLSRLSSVSLALTALKHNHQNLESYVHGERSRRAENIQSLVGDVEGIVEVLIHCFGATWEAAKLSTSPINLLSLRAVSTSQHGSYKLSKAFSGIPQWLEAVHSSGTLFEQVDLEAVGDDYCLEDDDVDGAPAEASPEPAEQNEAPKGSLAAAVSTWCSSHNKTGGESDEQQREQALALLGPHVARQALLAQKKAAAAAEAAEVERAEKERADQRAAARAEKEWRVEAVINKRVEEDKVEYRVKWLGYDNKHNTWELESSLQNCRKLIAQYECKHKTKKAKLA